MITILTGTPGAGKTLYAVSKLLAPLVGTFLEVKDDDGNVIERHPRTIYTNIAGLQVEHELIDGGAEYGLKGWHTWAKPGSVIAYDEVQKVWPRRPNGSAVPADIQSLDTHRHLGVDFILITQTVNNVDFHIHGLGNRHLHVRRVGNARAAIVYEWDHVSKTLAYPKAMVKTPWRYDKKAFRLYKSSQLHTKQPRSMSPLLYLLPVLLIALLYFGPTAWNRITGKQEAVQAKAQPAKPEAKQQPVQLAKVGPAPAGSRQPINDATDWQPRVYDKPETAPAFDALRLVRDMPQLVGAMCVNEVCTCYTQQNTKAQISVAACLRWSKDKTFNPYQEAASTRDALAARGAQPALSRNL